MLLLHGMLNTGEVFDPLMAALGRPCRFLVPDLRGHGRSSAAPGALDADALATDLVQILDDRDAASVHVVGFSFGGAVAQALARKHAERVRPLILISTHSVARLTWEESLLSLVAPPLVIVIVTDRLAALMRWVRPAGGGCRLSSAAATALATQVAANNAGRIAATIRATRTFDSRPWLGELPISTCVIAGTADRVVSPAQAELLRRGLPTPHVHYLVGAGHAVLYSHAHELAQVVAAWLEEDDGATPV